MTARQRAIINNPVFETPSLPGAMYGMIRVSAAPVSSPPMCAELSINGIENPMKRLIAITGRTPAVIARRIAGGIERPGDVPRRGRRPIVPADARPERERERAPVRAPVPLAREVGLGRERAVVAGQGREQDVALHLPGEGMLGEQGIDALQVGAGRVEHGGSAPAGLRLAGRETRRDEEHR